MKRVSKKKSKRFRIEKDSLGSVRVPSDAYYGAQTARAARLYQISGLRHSPLFIEAYLLVKKSAATVNAQLGSLDARKRKAIVAACDEILKGRLRDQFVVDVFQMGAGTSIHMNVNEVIANRANEILRGKRGTYDKVHANDDVNKGQSTNDTFPTAMRLSAVLTLKTYLEKPLARFEKELLRKGKKFDRVLKSARTHLQDAVPIRLGQEFMAYAEAVKRCRLEIQHAQEGLLEIGLGGSAAGTGLNTRAGYAKKVAGHLSRLMGLRIKPAKDLREAMQSQRPVAQMSACLRNLAIEVVRVANDLRLLSSGPRTGLSEINLPPTAPGSSMMPGKVNPSVPEMVNMVCFQVLGCDTAIAYAVQAGQLELNVMMPVMSFNLNFMIQILGNALGVLADRCVSGITCNKSRCLEYAHRSIGLATALNPTIGYAQAAEVAKAALKDNKTIVQIIRERGILSDSEIARILNPYPMTEPR